MRYFFKFAITGALLVGVVGSVSAGSGATAGASLPNLQIAIMSKEYAKANAMAQELLNNKSLRSDEQEIQYLQGLSTLRLGRYSVAEGIFRKLLSGKLSSEVADRTVAGLIDSLSMQGFYEKALKEANLAIARRKTSEMLSLFYLKAARANLKLARWVKAGEILHKIIADYPTTFESDAARRLLEEQQYFTVQVGAFIDKARAQRLADELARRKEYSYIVETRAGGRTYYRVRVGRLSALKDAVTLESKLSGLGYPVLIYP